MTTPTPAPAHDDASPAAAASLAAYLAEVNREFAETAARHRDLEKTTLFRRFAASLAARIRGGRVACSLAQEQPPDSVNSLAALMPTATKDY